jgi:signal transduction histidine kinase
MGFVGMRDRPRIRLPQTILVAAIGALLILAVSAVTSRISVHFHQQRETRLVERLGEVYLDGLSAVVAPLLTSGRHEDLRSALERVASYSDGVREVRVVVRLPDGRVVGELVRDPEAAAGEPPPLAEGVPLEVVGKGAWVWVQRPLVVAGRSVAVLSAQLDLRQIRDARTRATLQSLAANALLAVTLAAFGFFAMGRLLAPLKALEDALAAAVAGDPRPIPIDDRARGGRLGRLLEAFNLMVTAQAERSQMRVVLAERLRTADLGRLAATIAHEVRNPLAGMLNAVDTARRFRADPKVVTDSLDLLERGLRAVARVVETTLSTHRPPAGGVGTRQVDFDDLQSLVAAAADRQKVNLVWRAELTRGWPVDSSVVRQIVINLAVNALNAAGSGGSVAVRAWETSEGLETEVVDDGPGIAEAVADRLRRLDLDWIDTTEGGIGLGVVIRAVAALGGRIEVGSGPDGRGTRVVVAYGAAAEGGRA